MARVTGIGGLFFKSQNPDKMREWYERHLGIASDQYGGKFEWRDLSDPSLKCTTAWCIFPDATKHFDPGKQPFMINYRVENLKALLAELEKAGVQVVGKMEEYEYGKFAWIMDPEGQKIELWEPVDEKISE
jgi:predicted enzyme related to lactoylglutathione lyase